MSAGGLAKRGLILAVTGVSLYLLAPALLEVFGAFDRLDDFNPLWYVAMVALQIGSYGCMWAVQKLAVRAERYGPVITSQLASNAFGRVVPGGVAAAGAMQYAMLVRAGVPAAAAASGMAASSLLLFAILLALPVLAAPGDPVRRPGRPRPRLVGADRRGGVPHALRRRGHRDDLRPASELGRPGRAEGAQPHPAQANPLTGLPARLIRERNEVREVLGKRWWQALLLASGRWVLDYLTLLAALTAIGADPRPSTVLLAFCAAQFLGTLPLTPGGLGFVEAGLTGTLALAGVPAGAAVVATLAYRLVSFWLPIPAGGAAAIVHRRYYGAESRRSAPAPAREQRDRRDHAAADDKAGHRRADQRRLAVLGQLTAPVGQLRHLGAQVVDREAQLLARRLDRGSDQLGALGAVGSLLQLLALLERPAYLIALDGLRLELGARQLGLLDGHRGHGRRPLLEEAVGEQAGDRGEDEQEDGHDRVARPDQVPSCPGR